MTTFSFIAFDSGRNKYMWARVPQAAKNLLLDLTHPNPAARPNCDEILRCDWFREALTRPRPRS